MLTLHKTRLQNGIAAVLVLAGLLLTTCDMDMGLGPTVDLEPPTIVVTAIHLPDGTLKEIQEDASKLLIGPGILFGKEALLIGKAWDNKEVVSILVEEIGPGAKASGTATSWNKSTVSKKDENGWQNWSIPLDNIRRGEREILVTALDAGKNIGKDTSKQLTLLVDTEPPFVGDIIVERKPGVQVRPQPRARLQELDPNNFQYIDYFQNEHFSIRASIAHDFALSDVSLNFLDENGHVVFNQGLARAAGTTLFAPMWNVTHEDLVRVNAKYETGRHYMNILITARAEAGHSGQNQDVSNMGFSICWWPESDIPRGNIARKADEDGFHMVEKGGVLPLNVFDDDNVGEVYAAVVSSALWASAQFPGDTVEEKLSKFYNKATRDAFTDDNGQHLLVENHMGDPPTIMRNNTVPISVGSNRGISKLIFVVRDKKDDGTDGVWGCGAFDVEVRDYSIPFIRVDGPPLDSRPTLSSEGKFTLEGRVQNLDLVNVLKVAWIPAGLIASGADPKVVGEAAILASTVSVDNDVQTMPNGIKVWKLPLIATPGTIQIGDKELREQNFTYDFNIFTDFMYLGDRENDTKTFVVYTQGMGKGIDVFDYNFRVLAYDTPPRIYLRNPQGGSNRGPNIDVPFQIEIESKEGIPIDRNSVKLVSEKTANVTGLTGGEVRLSTDDGIIWTSIAPIRFTAVGEYGFYIDARDTLGNEAQQYSFSLSCSTPPILSKFTTSHITGDTFSSRNTVRIQVEFTGAVDVNLPAGTSNIPPSAGGSPAGRPRILLGGINNGGTAATRYAYYESGSGSYRLSFIYSVQPGDVTAGANGLQLMEFDLSPLGTTGTISANMSGNTQNPAGSGRYPLSGTLVAANNRPFSNNADTLNQVVTLNVDGVAPYITNITAVPLNNNEVAGVGNWPDVDGWLRSGHQMQISVTMSKDVKVLGNPVMKVVLNGGVTEDATFYQLNNNRTMVFRYKVGSGQLADTANVGVRFNAGPAAGINAAVPTCFDEVSRPMIVDTAGTQGNYLVMTGNAYNTGTETATSAYIRVDAVPPPALYVEEVTTAAAGSKSFRIRAAEIEADASKVEYTKNGATWQTVTPPYNNANLAFDCTASSATAFRVSARQVDRAGNVSGPSNVHAFNLGTNCDISGLICTNGNGTYGIGRSLNFKLLFTGKVYGTATVKIAGVTNPLSFTLAANAANTSISYTWVLPAGLALDPVEIENVNLSGIRMDGGDPFTTSMTSAEIAADYNSKHDEIAVLTIRPVLMSVDGALIADMSGHILPNSTRTLTLKFNHPVVAENGMITIRPANNWLIPPVLSTSEFNNVKNALSAADQNTLNVETTNSGYYKKTTHGLNVPATGNVTPDTTSKYVLNFDQGLDNATLRPIFERAKYLYQEIESISTVIAGDTVTVTLPNALDNGRQWQINIGAGAFLDKGGNTNALYESQNTTNGGSANGYFWSQTVKDPVIRVNRVSTNSPTAAPRTNTEYRIDCETPGAVILRGTYNRGTSITDFPAKRGVGQGVATIDNTMGLDNGSDTYASSSPPPNMTNANSINNQIRGTYLFRAHSDVGDWLHNSNIPDATAGAVTGMTISTPYTMGTTNLTVGDTSLYTARKDYIGATTTHGSITGEGKGYEGAFKTLVVFRNPARHYGPNNHQYPFGNYGNWRAKIEATDNRNGPVTTAGFPMDYNDMSGNKSRYMYINDAGGFSDRIFITWEIVVDYWQVFLAVNGSATNPPTALTQSGQPDSWSFWPEMWFKHVYRKYGNWGLYVGTFQTGNQWYEPSNPNYDYIQNPVAP